MASEHGEMVILLGAAMEDHGREITTTVVEELDDLAGTIQGRQAQLGEVSQHVARIITLLGEISGGVVSDLSKTETIIGKGIAVSGKLDSTAQAIRDRLVGTDNDTAKAGEEQAGQSHSAIVKAVIEAGYIKAAHETTLAAVGQVSMAIELAQGHLETMNEKAQLAERRGVAASTKAREAFDSAAASGQALKEYGNLI